MSFYQASLDIELVSIAVNIMTCQDTHKDLCVGTSSWQFAVLRKLTHNSDNILSPLLTFSNKNLPET